VAKDRKVEVGVLNIVTQPHSTQGYIDLFYKALKQTHPAQIRDKSYGEIGWLEEIDVDIPKNGLRGEIVSYLNIDPYSPWYDKRDKETLEIDKDNDIPPVSEDLKPHKESIYFVFFPKKHRLLFDYSKMKPSTAQKFFTRLFEQEIFEDDFDYIDVHVESNLEAIESILKIYRLSTLEITINRPNVDDTSDEEEQVLELLEEENARKLYQKRLAPTGQGLKPSHNTQVLMRVAKSNGKVEAVGYTELEEKVEESTIEHPFHDKDYYNPDRVSFRQAFENLAVRAYRAVVNKNGRQ